MREHFQCKGCGATYYAIQADNTLYFHVCALLRNPKTGEFLPRKGHRDESITTDAGGHVTGIRSEGAGVTPEPPTRIPEPTWLTRLKASKPAQNLED